MRFRPGDILFIRSGFTAAYNALSPSETLGLSKRPSADFIGVEPTVEILEWLWESQFAAVAGDSPSFERSPVGRGKTNEEGDPSPPPPPPPVVLHQWLLGGWGMPIGEMFDLEDLAKHCRECGRWSFFLSSVPLKASRAPFYATVLTGGVSSKVFTVRSDTGNTGTWWSGESTERSRYLLEKDMRELEVLKGVIRTIYYGRIFVIQSVYYGLIHIKYVRG